MSELTPEQAAQLVCRGIAERGGDTEFVLLNLFGLDLPEGMPGTKLGKHCFATYRDVAFYAYHGRVRKDGE